MVNAMRIVFATLHVRPSFQAVPLAAASLAAALPPEIRANSVLLDFFPGEKEAAWEEAILSQQPDLAAFPLYSWNRTAILALARRLRKRSPELRLVAGGPEATADPEGVLAEGELDAAIRGEGELPFRALIEAMNRSDRFAPPAGTTLRRAGGIIAGADHAPVDSLDDLPSPWLLGVLQPGRGEGVLWEIARGCPFACDFCFEGRVTRGVRHISQDRMTAELDIFVQAGVTQVWVLDSTFNFTPERGKDLLRLLQRKAPSIHFHLEAKTEFLDRETARLLSQIPCSVQLGLQSARPKILRNIHRSLDLELFTRKVHLLNAEGVTFGLDLIYGLPGDDYQGFRHSLNTALNLTPNHIDIFPLAVLPGTVLHRQRDIFGLDSSPHPPYELRRSKSCSPADLERCRILAAATQVFYNFGRAVGFFPALLKATRMTPVGFLQAFADWVLQHPEIDREQFLREEGWTAAMVLNLQEGFVADLLRLKGREDLVTASRDLLHYHFHYAETLLGPETLPAGFSYQRDNLWNAPWQVAPSLRMVSFAYEVLDVLEEGEVDLEQFASMLRPVGSTVLFLRRGDWVQTESLAEDFVKLLRGCDGRRTPEEIFAGSISRKEGEEIVDFAIAEGLLLPASGND
jgi:radical SAM superfamily enzyme YgiQ (UPF0313 family)